MAEYEIIRATELHQQAGAYYVRIQAMARAYHIPLRQEFDAHDGPDTKYIVVLDDGFPVATCRMYPLDARTAMLGRVVVLPEYRGKGLGSRTVRAGIDWMRDAGVSVVRIESRTEAVEFYRKLGFRTVSETVIHGETFDVIPMEMTI